jgi:hypothetical protein
LVRHREKKQQEKARKEKGKLQVESKKNQLALEQQVCGAIFFFSRFASSPNNHTFSPSFMQSREKLASEIPEEPPLSSPEVCALVLRLPDGKRIERRFLETETIETVTKFVQLQIDPLRTFRLAIPLPYQPLTESSATLKQAVQTKKAVLIIEELDT